MKGTLFVWTTIAVDVLREITCRRRQVLIVLASLLLLSFSSPGLAESADPPAWYDNFESGDFDPGWTEIVDMEVVSDPTGERPNWVASSAELPGAPPFAVMYKDGLTLGAGAVARVFFYDDGADYGDDHAAGLDAGLESIGIWVRYSITGSPSSEDYYLFDPGGLAVATDIPRTVGWHEFSFAIAEAGTTAFIDGVPVGTVALMTSADTFFIASEGGAEAYWDDVGIAPVDPTVLTVDTSDDVDDGACDVLHCSLREAINAANVIPGPAEISFGIPGDGPHTIQPLSTLPVITEPVIIDGYTQSGAVPATSSAPAVLKIELDGSNTDAHGLATNTGNSTIRGLVINGFSQAGILVHGAGGVGNVIEGNYIGTDVQGTSSLSNLDGVRFVAGASNNTVGGLVVAARNIISGNADSGVGIYGPDSRENLVLGNFIGTDSYGTAALGNLDGVWLGFGAEANFIGGVAPEARNLISGNIVFGVSLNHAGTSVNRVQGNFIGTDVSGTAALANGGGLVFTQGAGGNLVGGQEAGVGNTIAFNEGPGVKTHGDAGNTNAILGNSIHSNGDLGIDLIPDGDASDGVTLNDHKDFDSGPNTLQNFPELISLEFSTTSTIVRGKLNSTPGTIFYIEFFFSEICDPSGFGEGQNFIGTTTTVESDDNGDVEFTHSVGFGLPPGSFVTMTATEQDGDTSEFSSCIHPAASIVDLGDQIITYVPVDPYLGIVASPDRGPEPAVLSLCDEVTLELTSSDIVIVLCGSAHIEVEQGPVEILLGGNTVAIVPTAVTVIIEEVAGQLQLQNSSETDPVLIAVGGQIVAQVEPGEMIQEASVAITKAEVNAEHDDGQEGEDAGEDAFEIGGRFVRVEGGWIEILTEDVTFTLGSFSRTIPAGAFESDDDNHVFKFESEEDNGENIEIMILSTGEFKIEIEGVDLSALDLSAPVPFALQIGDDLGTVTIPFDEDGEFKG